MSIWNAKQPQLPRAECSLTWTSLRFVVAEFRSVDRSRTLNRYSPIPNPSLPMLVSWNWLQQYVPLTMSPREFEERLMMAGLNHEETHEVGDDLAIDLEVTSNRPDCLGHIGIAREVSVLWDCALTIPAARPAEGKTPRGRPRARAHRLPRSLPALHGPRDSRRPRRAESRLAGEAAGDDRHRGDQQRRRCLELRDDGMRPAAAHVRLCASSTGPEIIVRRPRAEETIEAIDHKTYRLDADMCVIADARVPVAIGGVMGGAATEVNERHSRRADRGGRLRSDFHPHHGPATGPAQRFVVSFRAPRRSARHRLGQPPLCGVDPGVGRRRIGRGRGRCRRAAAAAGADRAAACRN